MTELPQFGRRTEGADLYETLARVRAERRPAVLVTVIEVTGSAPQSAGAKMLVLEEGTCVGTVGGGALEKRVLEKAAGLLHSDPPGETELWTVNLTTELGMCCGGRMTLFLESIAAAERLVVFGAGHIGRALSPAAAAAGFEVTIVDEREEWADPSHFPSARQVLCEEPEVLLPELVLDASTYCVVVTHDHPLDQRILQRLISERVRFVGLVGSRAKRNKFLQRMRAQGVAEEELDRIRAPLGVDIGAVTPEEIAVSIVAELIAVRRGLTSGRAEGEATGQMLTMRPLSEEGS